MSILDNFYPYQKKAIKKFKDEKRLALFWGMGTGKTYVGTFLAVGFKGDGVVMCPKSLLFNWERNIHDWQKKLKTTKQITVLNKGTKKNVKLIDEMVSKHRENIFIITYESYKLIPTKTWKKVDKKFWILDESHKIKTPTSSIAKTVMIHKKQITNPDCRILLMSGTPITNKKYEEYYTTMHMIDVPEVGQLSFSHFTSRFATKVLINIPRKRSFYNIVWNSWQIDVLDKILLRHSLIKDSVDKAVEKTVFLGNIRDLKIDFSVAPFNGVRSTISYRTKKEKLAYLKEEYLPLITKEKNGAIFYNFDEEKSAIIELLKKEKREWIEMSGKKKESEKWDDGKIALVQCKVGEGYNFLTSAEIAVFYSPTVSSTEFSQCKKRLDRPGQKGNPVFIHFITHKVEEEILETIKEGEDFQLKNSRMIKEVT